MAAQEDYDMLSELCERLGLDEQESESFVSSAMGRLGHKMKQLWEDGDGDGNNSGGDFFSRGRNNNRQQRSTTPPRRRGSRENWMGYGGGR